MYGDVHYRSYVDVIRNNVDFDMRIFALLLFSRAYHYMDKGTGEVVIDIEMLSYECYMSITMIEIILNKFISIGLFHKKCVIGTATVYYVNADIMEKAK